MSGLDGRRIGWLMRSRAASHHHNYQHHTNPGGFDWHQPLSDNLFIRLNAATTHQTYCATHPYSIVIYLYREGPGKDPWYWYTWYGYGKRASAAYIVCRSSSRQHWLMAQFKLELEPRHKTTTRRFAAPRKLNERRRSLHIQNRPTWWSGARCAKECKGSVEMIRSIILFFCVAFVLLFMTLNLHAEGKRKLTRRL